MSKPDYYISRTGNAFAAEHLGDAYPPDQLYGLYGEYQFVAIYSDGQNQTLTTKLLQAFADGADAQTWSLTKQVDDNVMQNALDAPIAFVPQFDGLLASPRARRGARTDRHLQSAGPDGHHLSVRLTG